MNLLAHLYLANLTATSTAGQVLGDMAKGQLKGYYTAHIETGIKLHRRIDSFTDAHPVTAELRQRFQPPYRRYAGILVDIGFDYCLASNWPFYSDTDLPRFTRLIVDRIRGEWPANAPVPAQRLAGLEDVILNYRQPAGIQTALESVARRLNHDNPLAQATPVLLDEYDMMAAGFDGFFPELCAHVQAQVQAGRELN